MPKYSKYDKIEDFITGKLSSEEAAQFETEMNNDEELASEVQFQKLEHRAMDRLIELDLKSKMAKWDTSPPPNPFEDKPPPLKKNNGIWFTILIGLGALAIWGIFQMSPSETPLDVDQIEEPETNLPTSPHIIPDSKNEKQEQQSKPPEEVKPSKSHVRIKKKPAKKKPVSPKPKEKPHIIFAMNNYKRPDNFGTELRSKNDKTEESLYEKAVTKFYENEFRDVLRLLGASSEEDESKNRYLRGHAFFNLKNYSKAQIEFLAVSTNEFASDALDAEWYLLLTYLAQMPEEKVNFETLASKLISDEYSDYQEQAQKLKDAVISIE